MLGMVTMLGWRDEAYYNSDPWRGTWKGEGGGKAVLLGNDPPVTKPALNHRPRKLLELGGRNRDRAEDTGTRREASEWNSGPSSCPSV